MIVFYFNSFMVVTYDVFSHPSQKEGGNSLDDSNMGGTPLVLINKLLLFVVIGSLTLS